MNSEIWLYVALGIVVVGLIIAGVGVASLLSGIKDPMKRMKGSANNLKERMDRLNLETSNLQHHANELKEDMQVKSDKITTVVNAAQGAKNSVLDLNATVQAITKKATLRVEQDKENAAQVEQWSNMAIGLAQLWEYRKAAKRRSADSYPTTGPSTKRKTTILR